jgi:DNA-binding response OmpR family regulator
MLASGRFDLITLDIKLPDGNGYDFCREIRRTGLRVPVIMLTTEVGAESVARGLEVGADDYLKKPIEAVELRARLRGHLRREAAEIEFAELRMDPQKRQVHFREQEIVLTGRQFEILLVLLRRPEVVLTRESLISQLGRDLEISDRTVDSHVSQLRKRLKEAGVDRLVITPVYGVGYRLEES